MFWCSENFVFLLPDTLTSVFVGFVSVSCCIKKPVTPFIWLKSRTAARTQPFPTGNHWLSTYYNNNNNNNNNKNNRSSDTTCDWRFGSVFSPVTPRCRWTRAASPPSWLSRPHRSHPGPSWSCTSSSSGCPPPRTWWTAEETRPVV